MGGNVLGDLHDGKGTAWTKTPDGQYYPNCDCHGPESLRHKPAAADAPGKGKRAPAVKSDALAAIPDDTYRAAIERIKAVPKVVQLGAPESDRTRSGTPRIDNETAGLLIARRFRAMLKRRKP
jgi:hypothetical protein